MNKPSHIPIIVLWPSNISSTSFIKTEILGTGDIRTTQDIHQIIEKEHRSTERNQDYRHVSKEDSDG